MCIYHRTFSRHIPQKTRDFLVALRRSSVALVAAGGGVRRLHRFHPSAYRRPLWNTHSSLSTVGGSESPERPSAPSPRLLPRSISTVRPRSFRPCRPRVSRSTVLPDG